MKSAASKLLWILVIVLGAQGYVVLALHRGESVSSAHLLLAALCTYAIGYRFYSKWLAARVLALNDRRATPCEMHDDGKDFVKTNKWIVFGHHFAAISGPGPLVGPVLAAQFGYLPGTLWILIGVVLGGAVQDMVILFASLRRDGKSLGQMVKEELNGRAGFIALISILAIMVILLAVLGLVVVKALAESPWGVFTVGATIPIAMFMGGYMRFWRVGRVLEASAIGVAGLLLAVWGGKLVYQNPDWSRVFGLTDITLAWAIILYGLAASILPVWLLLAPRDYLSTFMKLGTIFALALGIFLVLPDLSMPAVSKFVDGSGLVVAGKLFPFCFITIACGAISGFHTLIASGTTPKMLTREGYARPVGYGAMCLESLVAIMAMVAACTLDPGIYLSMNVKGTGATPQQVAADTIRRVENSGFTVRQRDPADGQWKTMPVKVSAGEMEQLAREMGEKTLYGRTGGAATLAVGMAHIFSRAVSGRWLDLWYHFAIMFEALFILTTLDAGTRVGRYILQDFLGGLWKPLGDTRRLGPNLLASGLMVLGWGYFLVQGVRDPLGGINSLWPLFGIANQMLAAIALCLATTILLKMQLGGGAGREGGLAAKPGRPWLALVTIVPMIWLVSVTFTAGVQKIFHEFPRVGHPEDPPIGFLAQARVLDSHLPALQAALGEARASGNAGAAAEVSKALRKNRTLHFNNVLDACVAGAFLVLVGMILLLSLAEWILLLGRRKTPELRETPPTWLPDYAVAEGKPLRFFGLFALLLALARELTGEAEAARVHERMQCCAHEGQAQGREPGAWTADASGRDPGRVRKAVFVQTLERRFRGIRRCC